MSGNRASALRLRHSGLTVGQAFHVLQQGGQSEPPWCFGGLASAGKKGSKLRVMVDSAKCVRIMQT